MIDDHIHELLRRWDAAVGAPGYVKDAWRDLRRLFEAADESARPRLLAEAENLCRAQGGVWPPARASN